VLQALPAVCTVKPKCNFNINDASQPVLRRPVTALALFLHEWQWWRSTPRVLISRRAPRSWPSD
jgi:hypothetical protein